MIQRIQSIFLLLSSLSIGSLFLESITFADVEVIGGNNTVLSSNAMLQDSVFNIMDNTVLIIIAALVVLLSLIAIFLYKDRMKQKLVNRLSIVGSIVLLILASLFFFNAYNELSNTETYLFEVEYGALSPILGIIFGFLANHFINKDENLVRSQDRLR